MTEHTNDMNGPRVIMQSEESQKEKTLHINEYMESRKVVLMFRAGIEMWTERMDVGTQVENRRMGRMGRQA